LRDHVQRARERIKHEVPTVSKTVTRRQGVSRVRIPPPPLSSWKRLQEGRIPIGDQR
jgi:hypothetical protein